MKSKNKNKTTKKRKTATPGGAARPLLPPQLMTPGFRPLMQGQLVERPSGKQPPSKPSGTGKQTAHRPTGSGGKVMPSASKRPRLDSQQQTPPAPVKPFLTLQEANELKEEIARLDSEYQFRILEILQANGEKLVPDEDGEVEIEIVSCSAKSVTEVKAFLAFVKKAAALAKSKPVPPPPQQHQRVAPSGGGKTLSHPPPSKSKAKSPKGGHLNKIKPEKTSRLSDSSSDDSSSSDSSSDDSSDSSSDSEEN